MFCLTAIHAPQVLNIPVRLDGPVPSPARQFVWRQMEVMQERCVSKAEAAKIVRAEMVAKTTELYVASDRCSRFSCHPAAASSLRSCAA